MSYAIIRNTKEKIWKRKRMGFRNIKPWCNYSIDFLVKIIYNGNIKLADCKFWI